MPKPLPRPSKPTANYKTTSVPNGDNGDHEDDEEKGKGAVASLPTPDVIDDPFTARHARELLEEAFEIKLRHDQDTKRLKELTKELVVVSRGFQLPGVRYGQIGLVYSGERSNRYLDKGLLLEHGVSPEVLADCYKPGKPFSDAKFYLIKR